ncbi:MAG: DUF4302 domain-containing protein [Prevotellaceae bacterium]|jgi:hypothetical protein|nr:DUF4302 domain-containing protein [Prevotellaceae bacterium]
MKLIKNIIYLLILPLFIMQSCVKDEENIFDDTAAARGQKAVAQYSELLVSAENGWYLDYYPELNHKVGGYAMYVKFTNDGLATVSCEIETNLPPRQNYTSEFSVFMEQGPILAFSEYNEVMHFFSEPSQADINGLEGDYEFIIMKAEQDEIQIKGKKGGNKMTLRRNVNNINPDTHLAEVAVNADKLSSYVMFEFVANDETIGIASVIDRTFNLEYDGQDVIDVISYAFTTDGIRLYEPFIYNEVTMQNFIWDDAEEKYTCTDQGVNAYFRMYFPPDFQIKYEDFLGRWELQYQPRNSSAWQTARMDTVEFVQIKKNSTLRMVCDKMFNFSGIIVNFNSLKGVISIIGNNSAVHSSGYDIRVCPYATIAGYISTSITNGAGLVGVWNEDTGGDRIITFEDNKIWGTYKADGILLRLMDSNGVSQGNYTGNIGGLYGFRNLILKKID